VKIKPNGQVIWLKHTSNFGKPFKAHGRETCFMLYRVGSSGSSRDSLCKGRRHAWEDALLAACPVAWK
jgi:hypothetical protein